MCGIRCLLLCHGVVDIVILFITIFVRKNVESLFCDSAVSSYAAHCTHVRIYMAVY